MNLLWGPFYTPTPQLPVHALSIFTALLQFASPLSISPFQSTFLSVSPAGVLWSRMLIQIDFAVNLNFSDISPPGCNG